MIDIHTHILPGVDDGSKNDVESLLMLKAAISEGIGTLVATPHRNQRYVNEKPDILVQVNKLKQLAKENGLDVEILPGQEVRIYGELLADYSAGKLLTLGDHSSYLLVEFPFRQVPLYAEQLLHEMVQSGITPVIAHPERVLDFLENPEKLYKFVAQGALTQVTAASMTGYFGKKVQKFSHQLIESNLIHTLATDAHNLTDRSFSINDAYEEVRKKHGGKAVSYFKENAHLIIKDQPVDSKQPKPIDSKKFFGIF